ncbi:MAG TPA: ARMT1-like domain-containing protein [bacterium]|nr:ARMT1-like domain-containing protein [bacterium]
MQTALDCIPCFAWQAVNLARRFSDDPAVHEQIVRETLRGVADLDYTQTPPVVAQQIHRRLRALTGLDDPFAADKRRHNDMMLRLLPELERQVVAADDPLAAAVRFAIAGNVIDLGVRGGCDHDQLLTEVREAAAQPLAGDYAGFAQAVRGARRILYIADNAGEIVADRLLLAQLPSGTATVAVRGAPILNDAVMADAAYAGLTALVPVISSGCDAPGVIIAEGSAAFREAYAAADLVIAKGQGNFETLSGSSGPVWCLFRVKCGPVAAAAGLPVGSHAVLPVGMR